MCVCVCPSRPSVTNVTSANISEPGPFRGLNFGTQADWTVGHAFLRPKASVCAWRSALGAKRDITSLLMSRSPGHLEGRILARRPIDAWAILCRGRGPRVVPCALRLARLALGANAILQICTVSQPGPLRELNFGMYIEQTMRHAMPRPKA